MTHRRTSKFSDKSTDGYRDLREFPSISALHYFSCNSSIFLNLLSYKMKAFYDVHTYIFLSEILYCKISRNVHQSENDFALVSLLVIREKAGCDRKQL